MKTFRNSNLELRINTSETMTELEKDLGADHLERIFQNWIDKGFSPEEVLGAIIEIVIDAQLSVVARMRQHRYRERKYPGEDVW